MIRYGYLTAAAIAAIVLVRAATLYAGATTIPEFRLGSCGSGQAAPACGWDCDLDINAFPATCPDALACALDVTETFTAHVVVRVDDAPCGAAGGAVVEIGLRGRRQDQSEFVVPSRTIDLCGVDNACGGCDTGVCTESDASCPLDVMFHCELTGPNEFGPELCDRPLDQQSQRRMCEADVQNLGAWFFAGKQPILGEMAADLAEHFPSATGPAVVLSGFDLEVVDNSGDPGQPTIGRFCFEIGFLRTPKSTPIPAAVLAAPRTTSGLVVKGGCACGDGVQDPGEGCDDGNVQDGDGCDAGCQTECPPAPDPGCESAFADGLLSVNEKKPGKEKIALRWLKGPALAAADFGNPLSGLGTSYNTCVYDGNGALVRRYAVARAGDTCGGKPCWKALGKPPGDPGHKGYKYKDKATTADGTLLVLLKGGEAGKSKAAAKGRNAAPKGQTALPTGTAAALAGSSGATIQLSGSDAPKCFSVTLGTVQKDDGGTTFSAKK